MWYAVIESATGRLVSIGTRLADTGELSRKGYEAIELGEAFEPDGLVWDETKRAFDQAPVVVPPTKDQAIAVARTRLEEALAELAKAEQG